MKTGREIMSNWEKLDNTAHLFPVIANENMSNVYRISAVLNEEVQRDLLQEALDFVLPKFPGFNLRLRRGFFWYYFEENGKKAPTVREENTFPCRAIYPGQNRNYLFRVSYYKKRINLEVFHSLADGTGAMTFLKELTYKYLRLAHPEIEEKIPDRFNSGTSLNRDDSFLKHYRKKSPKKYGSSKAYIMKGEKLRAGELGVIHGKMSVSRLKEYKPYIDHFYTMLAVSKGQHLKGAVCSYEDSLVFTFSYDLKDVSVQRCFFRKLVSDGVDVEIETNGVEYE